MLVVVGLTGAQLRRVLVYFHFLPIDFTWVGSGKGGVRR